MTHESSGNERPRQAFELYRSMGTRRSYKLEMGVVRREELAEPSPPAEEVPVPHDQD